MQAVLTAVKRSLGALRKRLGGSQGGGVFFLERPFFNVSLQLAVPHVICSPGLGDIQAAINAATKKVRALALLPNAASYLQYAALRQAAFGCAARDLQSWPG